MNVEIREFYLFDNVPLLIRTKNCVCAFSIFPLYRNFGEKRYFQEIQDRMNCISKYNYQNVGIVCCRWNTGLWATTLIDLPFKVLN